MWSCIICHTDDLLSDRLVLSTVLNYGEDCENTRRRHYSADTKFRQTLALNIIFQKLFLASWKYTASLYTDAHANFNFFQFLYLTITHPILSDFFYVSCELVRRNLNFFCRDFMQFWRGVCPAQRTSFLCWHDTGRLQSKDMRQPAYLKFFYISCAYLDWFVSICIDPF